MVRWGFFPEINRKINSCLIRYFPSCSLLSKSAKASLLQNLASAERQRLRGKGCPAREAQAAPCRAQVQVWDRSVAHLCKVQLSLQSRLCTPGALGALQGSAQGRGAQVSGCLSRHLPEPRLIPGGAGGGFASRRLQSLSRAGGRWEKREGHLVGAGRAFRSASLFSAASPGPVQPQGAPGASREFGRCCRGRGGGADT